MQLQFLGATRQVTGSCYYLEAAGMRILVDCGLFQERQFQDRNWGKFPVEAKTIDLLLLTHAHLDHAGLIPKLVREGFHGRILCTPPSVDLAKIVMLDSARIQEEDAKYKKKRHEREGRTGRFPELPLYTTEDAERATDLLEAVPYHEDFKLSDAITVCFHDAGHILGSSMLEMKIRENGEERRLVFSGDIGQWDKPLIRDPSILSHADYLVMESTYGDREHEHNGDPEMLLGDAVNETVMAGGNLLIPTFAIERAQELMFYLGRLIWKKKIPQLMVFLDSPMAVNVTEVFTRYPQLLDDETQAMMKAGHRPLEFPGLELSRSVEQSKSINQIRGTCIIMAGSGMANAGRIKHHLKHNLSRPGSTVLFVGYQARGTLGRILLEGADEVRIHGQYFPVKARIQQIHGFSAHADRAGLWRWLEGLENHPRHLFLTHGEDDVALGFAEEIRQRKGWQVSVPEYQQRFELQ